MTDLKVIPELDYPCRMAEVCGGPGRDLLRCKDSVTLERSCYCWEGTSVTGIRHKHASIHEGSGLESRHSFRTPVEKGCPEAALIDQAEQIFCRSVDERRDSLYSVPLRTGIGRVGAALQACRSVDYLHCSSGTAKLLLLIADPSR